MPTYDYNCLKCKRRFSIFLTYDEYGKKTVLCPHCQSDQVQRRIGRIRIAKSDESRMEGMTDESALEGMENDPQALGRMMKKMGKEMGEDLPPEFDDMVDRLEAGQSPEEIESAMPDLGAGGGNTNDDE